MQQVRPLRDGKVFHVRQQIGIPVRFRQFRNGFFNHLAGLVVEHSSDRVLPPGPDRVNVSAISAKLYDRALQQVERLKNGEVGYKKVDGRYRLGGASNCIHAVCDIAERETLFTGTAWGEPASEMVVDHFHPWLIDPFATHDWLIDQLGLGQYAVTFKKLPEN